MQYTDSDEIKEIGFDGYGMAYTAKYKGKLEEHMTELLMKRRTYLSLR